MASIGRDGFFLFFQVFKAYYCKTKNKLLIINQNIISNQIHSFELLIILSKYVQFFLLFFFF